MGFMMHEWLAKISSHWHIVALGISFLALSFIWWLVRFLGKSSWGWRRKSISETMQILDSCAVDYERRLIMFSSPFGQGLILASPKGDQLVLLPNAPSQNNSHYTDASL